MISTSPNSGHTATAITPIKSSLTAGLRMSAERYMKLPAFQGMSQEEDINAMCPYEFENRGVI